MKSCSGFSLIEVLLAWSILMTVLLTALALQIKNLQKVRHAYFYSIATVQLQSMAERLRANIDTRFRSREQEWWNLQNKEVLPKGEGHFQCHDHGQVCTLILHWQEGEPQTIMETILL